MSNPFKEQLSKSAEEEQKRKEEERKRQEETEIRLLSFFQKGRNLTKEEKREILEMDENMILKEKYRMMYYIIKTYIQTGEIPEIESYVESCRKRKEKETSLKILSVAEKGKNLTKKDLEIDERMISKEMYHMIYYVMKTYVQTGEVPEVETYVENYKKRKKISLEEIPTKWEKAPEEWEK